MSAKYYLSVGCWIRKGSQYLLQKRSADDSFGASKWLIVGGKVEENETVIQALEREIMEESNVKIDTQSIRLIKDYLFDKDESQKIVMVFVAVWLSGEAKALEAGTEVKWVELSDLDKQEYAFDTSLEEVKIIQNLQSTHD